MIAIFPEIAAAAAAGEVDRLAILVRRYFCDRETFAPKPDVRRLMINAGMDVKSLPMDAHGALLAKDERGAFKIVAVINERVGDPDRRFLLAHMLGHYLLEVQPVIARGDWQVSGFREVHCPAKRYAQGPEMSAPGVEARKEALADEFAAALLLPRGMVRRALEQLKDQEKAASFFGVGAAVLTRRLIDIGAVAQRPANFLDAERQLTRESDKSDAPKTSVATGDQAMPRSYAASTYGQTERTTRKVETAPGRGSSKGMERLREIARKMEKPK